MRVPLLNFERAPWVPLSNFRGRSLVPLLNFVGALGPGFRVPGPKVSRFWSHFYTMLIKKRKSKIDDTRFFVLVIFHTGS